MGAKAPLKHSRWGNVALRMFVPVFRLHPHGPAVHKCRRYGGPFCRHAPADRRATLVAGLLALGSSSCRAFPELGSSGTCGEDSPVTVAGTAADLPVLPGRRTAFPFDPLAEDHQTQTYRSIPGPARPGGFTASNDGRETRDVGRMASPRRR